MNTRRKYKNAIAREFERERIAALERLHTSKAAKDARAKRASLAQGENK